MKKIITYLCNLSVKKKFIITILAGISLLSITSFISLSIVVKSYNDMLYRSLATTLSYSASNISNKISISEALSSTVVVDETMQTYLSRVKDSEDFTDLKEANRIIYKTISSYYQQFQYNHLSYMAVYSDKFTTSTFIESSLKLPDELLDELLRSAVGQRGVPIIVTKYSDTYGLFILREIRRVEEMAFDTLGVLVICIDINDLIEDSSDFASEYGNPSYLLSSGNDILLNHANVSKEETQTLITQKFSPFAILELSKTRYFVVSCQLSKYGWKYISLLPYHSVYQAIITAREIFICILFVSVIISLSLSIRLSATLAKHLDNLVRKIRAFSETKGQLVDVKFDYHSRKDEFGLLHNNFDEMANEISTLINVNLRSEIFLKEARIKALEMQINPHFLYNTLESINWRAKMIGEKQISQMIESLGYLLRVTLDEENGIVSLKEELDYIKYYIAIQKVRFGEQLEFDMEVQKDIHEHILLQKVPKLIIQPLVENAIHYGVEMDTDVCNVSLSIYRQGITVKIDVKNSGSQFEEDLLEKLNSGENTPRGMGIGLLNINNRLKLTFGNDYGITCFNDGKYAIAQITIPISS